MIDDLAASITKVGSTQTYYTIRFLVDRGHLQDAYRTYGYFRWVDDVIDSNSGSASGKKYFVERQKDLLESCYRGEPLKDVDIQEEMLVELVSHDREKNSGLQSYLRNMMSVMEFDVNRRGRLISQAELNEYTRWLSIAVTDAMHYFIGHGEYAPSDDTRILAVSAAHIIHMLRDTFDDMKAGYYNIPREVLEANHIGPTDTNSDGYRLWVKSRVELASRQFELGRDYFNHVQSRRYRLAGIAYIARFEWLLRTIEQEEFLLRPQYNDRKRLGAGLSMTWLALSALAGLRGEDALGQPAVAASQSKI